MTDFRTAWEHDYVSRGQLWGGCHSILPEIPAGSRVLEIGCGNGKIVNSLVNRSCDITAIDFSQKAVAMSHRIITRYHIGDSLVADARCLPFRNNAFNIVIASHVFGHMLADDRKTISSETERVLQPGGYLVFSEFSVDDLRMGRGEEVEDATYLRGAGIITHYFTEPEIETLFCALKYKSIITRCWKMRVKGRDMIRAEIVAVFSKKT